MNIETFFKKSSKATYPVTSFKQKIIELFNKNVKGKNFNNDKLHCGSEGHWLESQMEIAPNSNNEPDKYGWEQKKCSSKITFGDWRASEYYFEKSMSRSEFLQTFGSKNSKKNRYSWSGSIFPKFGNEYNYAGQRIIFDDNEDLVIEYLYKKDTREKINFRKELKIDKPIVLARWKKSKLENHILKKFGQKGFYICEKNKQGMYYKISFGKPIDFEFFKNGLENRKIILDSGMYEGNNRYYSQFRAPKTFWNQLIIEEYQ